MTTDKGVGRARRGITKFVGALSIGAVGMTSLLVAPTALAAPQAPAAPSPAAPTIEQVSATLQTLQHQAEVAAEAYNSARERLSSIQIKVQAADVRVKQQQAAIASTKQQIGRIAVVLYREGELSSLEVVMSDDPDALLTRAGLATSVVDRQATLVAHLHQQELRLKRDQASVRGEQRAAAALNAQMASSKRQADAKVGQVQAQLARLKAEERRALERASRERERRALVAASTPSRRSARSSNASSGGSSSSGGGTVAVGPGGSVRCGSYTISAPSSRAAKALAYACSQLGEPYSYGSAGPGSWDCSGLTMMSWRAGGVSLPHSSSMQYGYGSSVSRSSLQPGDLVFFYSPISHVGMYVGGGMMIHAPHTGDVVRLAPLYSGYVGARRV